MTEQLLYELFFLGILFGLIGLRLWSDKNELERIYKTSY